MSILFLDQQTLCSLCPQYGLNFEKYIFLNFVQPWCHNNINFVLMTSPHSYNCFLMIPIEFIMICLIVALLHGCDDFHLLVCPFAIDTHHHWCCCFMTVSHFLGREQQNKYKKVEEQCNLAQ